MRTRRFFIVALVILAGVVAPFLNAQSEPPINVSIVQLIANPEKYDGKLVSLVGFIHIGREQDLIFLGEEDFNHAVFANALWFHLSEDIGKNWQKLNRNYVGVVGVFSARHEGPYSCPNGGLTTIKRVQVWSTTENPTGKALDAPKPDN
jgi:hypothetical protein